MKKKPAIHGSLTPKQRKERINYGVRQKRRKFVRKRKKEYNVDLLQIKQVASYITKRMKFTNTMLEYNYDLDDVTAEIHRIENDLKHLTNLTNTRVKNNRRK